MSNSTKNLIATIMANSAEENMAKLILDIKKKKAEIGISKNDVASGNVAKMDGILTQSEIYKKIRSALKNKKPTFYFIENDGDKTIIFLKKGDNKMKRYEIEGDLAIPANITSAVSAIKTSDIETYQAYIISICFDLNRLIGAQTIQIPAPAPVAGGVPGPGPVPFTGTQFMNAYIEVLVDFIDECTVGDLHTYIDSKFPNQSGPELFYHSLRNNPDTNKIMDILENITTQARNVNCVTAGGSKKMRGGAKIEKRKFLLKIKNAMSKGLPSNIKKMEVKNQLEQVKKLMANIRQRRQPFQINLIQPLGTNELKTFEGRYEAFKNYLNRYLTNIDPPTFTINNTPIEHIHYIDFDLSNDKLISSKTEQNVRNTLNAATGGRDAMNNQLKQFILKSKKSVSGKSNKSELYQFVLQYIKDINDVIIKGSSRGANQAAFLPFTFADERAMKISNATLTTFNSTEYRLYQLYKRFYDIFNTHLNTALANYPFQLPNDSEMMRRIVWFIMLKLRNTNYNMGNAAAPGAANPSATDITNTIFNTNDLPIKYIHRYYREKERSILKGAPTVDMTILEIEKSNDSLYHAVLASAYSRNVNLTDFLAAVGNEVDNLNAATGAVLGAVAAAGNPRGQAMSDTANAAITIGGAINTAVDPAAPGLPEVIVAPAGPARLGGFAHLRNALNVVRYNGEQALHAAAGGGGGGGVVSIRSQINAGANKRLSVVEGYLNIAVDASKLTLTDISTNANKAFSEYRTFFTIQLRKVIGDRIIEPNSIFENYLKEMIKKIRNSLQQDNSKPNANVSATLNKNASLSKYKDTFVSKVFRKISDFPTDAQLNTPADFDALKVRISDSIKTDAKACDFEFMVLNTLIQCTIADTGFFDISNQFTGNQKVDSYILMGNEVYKQLMKIKVSTPLSTCILLQGIDQFHYNAVIRGALKGATKDLCEKKRGVAAETIIGYNNLIVAQTGFKAAKAPADTNAAVADLNTFYGNMLAYNKATPAIGAAIVAITQPNQNAALNAIIKKKADPDLAPFTDFLYDPDENVALIQNLRTHIEMSEVVEGDFHDGTDLRPNVGVTGAGIAGHIQAPLPLARFDVNA